MTGSTSPQTSREALFQGVRTLVVKVGTRVLCPESGLDETRLEVVLGEGGEKHVTGILRSPAP